MACTYDAKSSGTATGTSVTVAHTIGGNADRLLLVVEQNSGASSATGITYNTVAMTKLYSVSPGYRGTLSVWYMLESDLPTAGARNIVASYGGSVTTYVIAMSVYNCLQDAPGYTNNSGIGTVYSATRTFANAGSIGWLAALSDEDWVMTAAAGETLLYALPTGEFNWFAASYDDRDAGSQTLTINSTAGSAPWQAVIVELGPPAAAGVPVTQVIWIPEYTA